MTRASVALGAIAIVLIILAVVIESRTPDRDAGPVATPPPARTPTIAPPPAAAETPPPAQTDQGFLYGRVTAVDGATYTGRLRWGRDQEAFWNDYFNGAKREDPWLAYVPRELVPEQRRPRYVLGFNLGEREGRAGRLFMVRFGEIARIEARGRVVQVTLRGGSVVELDRFDASDFDDGVRVWDGRRGVVDFKSVQIRTIELLPTPPLGGAPHRLHGTVRTRLGDFTGFVQWDREECVGTDELDGHTDDGERSLRFDTIRSIARRSSDSSLVTLLDGREMVLSGTNDVGRGHRGVYVDDPRYGRVLISWEAFERVDFSPGGSGPGYGDFPPGRPLTGSVTTRAGRRLAGRLVYDLEESETIETLDAPSEGVDYTLLFGRIASIAPPGREERGPQRAGVTLHGGEELRLELEGDLGYGNGGMLVFVEGRERAEYVPWADVARVDFDPPPATSSPLGGG